MKQLYIITLILLNLSIQAQDVNLLNDKNPEIAQVAMHLLGNWIEDNSLMIIQETRVSTNAQLNFTENTAIATIYKEIYQSKMGKDIYLAGTTDFWGTEDMFVLLDVEDRPLLVLFRDKPSKAGTNEGLYRVGLEAGESKRDDILVLEPLNTTEESLLAYRRKVLSYQPSKENVVSTHLIGSWEYNKKLAVELSEQNVKINKISFELDSTIVDSIPMKYNRFLDGKTIYLAGRMSFLEETFPFVLITHEGNPHLVYFREKNGNPMGDSESFNLFIAQGDDPKKDMLFIGGDFNNQPFFPFKRK